MGEYSLFTINRRQSGHIVAAWDWDRAWRITVSYDGGGSFSSHVVGSAASGSILAIGLDPSDNQIMYVGGSLSPGGASGGVLYKTTDGGLTWTDVTGPIAAGSIDQIEIPSGNPGFVVVRAGASLFRSVDGGVIWTDITPPDEVTSVRVNPELPSEIYCGTASGDFLLSEDGGDSWTSIGVVERVQTIDVAPCIKTVFAGTSGGGVFRNRLEDKWFVEIGSSDAGTTDPPPGLYGYADGSQLDITAIPANGWKFKGWTGDAAGKDNPLHITVGSDIKVQPEFYLAAPKGFSVVQREARSLFIVQSINVLTWQPATGVPTLTGYRIYLLGDDAPLFLAQVGASASTYWHRGVAKGKAYRYVLVAVDTQGVEGEAAIAQIGAAPAIRRSEGRTRQMGGKGALIRR